MSLLAPMWLWAFGLALPLIGVYLLKVRPRRAPVTAFFLWDRVFVERRASAFFRRLRGLLSLLLMFAALSALVLASARPRFRSADQRDLFIIVDQSQSMSTRTTGGLTRLDLARRQARDLIAALPDDRRAAVASVSDRLTIACGLTEDRRTLYRAVDGIESTALGTPRNVLEAIDGVDQIDDRLRVVLISDAVGEDFVAPAGVELLKVGEPEMAENVGFVAADLVKAPSSDQLTLFFQLGATQAYEGMEADVSLLCDGALVKLVPVTLASGVNEAVVTSVAGRAGKYELRVHLADQVADSNPLDDVVALTCQEPRPVRVAVSHSARFFFENAVIAFERSEGLVRLAAAGEGAEIALLRGGEAPGEAAPASIVFAAESHSRWVEVVGERIESAVPRAKVRNHPAFRYVSPEDLAFAGARQVTLPAGAAVLVEDVSGAPLVWQIRDDAGLGIVLNLDPALDDFFLSPYFPLIVRGAAAYVAGRSETVDSVYRTGESVAAPGLAPGQLGEVVGPGEAGVVDAATALRSGERLRLDRPGYYAVSTPRGDWTLSAAALHRDETLDRPELVSSSLDGLVRGTSIWRQLVVLALLLLMGEEMLYHRRRVD